MSLQRGKQRPESTFCRLRKFRQLGVLHFRNLSRSSHTPTSLVQGKYLSIRSRKKKWGKNLHQSLKSELSKYLSSWMWSCISLIPTLGSWGREILSSRPTRAAQWNSNNDNNNEQTFSRQMSLLLYVIPLCDSFSFSCRSRNSKT